MMSLIKKSVQWPLLILLAFMLHSTAFAIDPIFKASPGSASAINGYDPVAYFTESKPVRGQGNLVHEWNGARWHFSSVANKAAFMANPEKYAPQYGGYCAYAASKGAVAKTDPEAWHVRGGKLYLNLSKLVQEIWREDIPGNIVAADKNWPGLLAQ